MSKSKLQTIIDYAIEKGWTDGAMDATSAMMMFEANNPSILERGVLTSHSFLKAVFGEDKLIKTYGLMPNKRLETSVKKEFIRWQYHAQQMVISKDPVDYVYQWVKEQSNE